MLPVVKLKSVDEVIKFANETMYGLGAYVYTADKEVARQVAENLEAGMVSVNGISYIRPYNPFGGYKSSGFGREHGKYGFHEVTRVKVVAKNK